jgi:hypothetical protein
MERSVCDGRYSNNRVEYHGGMNILFNSLKSQFSLNHISRLSSYCPVNTLRLCYENQSVNSMQGNYLTFLYKSYKMHK